ncbi:carbonic anhydrase [Globomyces pollinis-pini]|nr:carbonic anhydrase [Globomyces pollinis-pini]
MKDKSNTISPHGSIQINISGGSSLDTVEMSPNKVLSDLSKTMKRSATVEKLDKFLSGYKRFHKNYFCENQLLFKTLQTGQAPKTVLIGCCDSRVDPAIITDCDPGDIFVVRNVANLVAPHKVDFGYHGTASALEYAVRVLQVENIIILGHSHCGGIELLMQSDDAPEFEYLGHWMSMGKAAKDKTLRFYSDQPRDVQNRACEKASILQSLENCVSYPWIHEKLKDGSLSLTGWYFDFDTGKLLGYNSEKSTFESLDTDECNIIDRIKDQATRNSLSQPSQ